MRCGKRGREEVPWFVSIFRSCDHKEGGNRSAFCAESKVQNRGRKVDLGEGQCSVSFLHTSGLSTVYASCELCGQGRNKEQK